MVPSALLSLFAVVGVATATITTPPCSGPQSQIVVNPSFEDGFNGWTPSRGNVVGGDAADGVKFL